LIIRQSAIECQLLFVEAAKEERAEEDGPDTKVDFFEADVFFSQDVGDVEPVGVPADAAVSGDAADFEVGRIVDGRDGVGEGSRGGLVAGGRGVLVESLMRAEGIVFVEEVVKASLLSWEVFGGREGRFGFEGAVEAFVAAVLLGLGGLDGLRRDAEFDPPDVKAREAVDGLGGKRGAVVGADDMRKAKATEKVLKDGLDEVMLGGGESMAGEEEAAVAIEDG
jgi:hypothetical protein